MSILHASSRCVRGIKLTSSPPPSCSYPLTHSLLKSASLNRHCYIASRHLSWEGFYYSLSSSAPVLTLQNVLLDFHSFSGLPWWAVISLTTLGIRSLCVFPLVVHQNQVIHRLMNVRHELQKMAPELNKEVNMASRMYGWDRLSAKRIFHRSMQEYKQKFILRDNCHPFKIVLLAIFQIPVWICFSVSLRNLAMNSPFVNCDTQELQQQFKSEGILWFTDLTMPDSFIIPFLLTFVNLLIVEINALRFIGKRSMLQTFLINITRIISIAVAYGASLNPAAVSFYWLCSSTFGLAQNILLMSPRFRRILRIPSIPNESLTPFKDIACNFRKRFLK